MKIFLTLLSIFLLQSPTAQCEPSIAPLLYFYRSSASLTPAKKAGNAIHNTAPVTVRFHEPPNAFDIDNLEQHGLIFKRDTRNGILHTARIYLATVDLDSLETLATFDSILRIENINHPSRQATLDNSIEMVQAPLLWETSYDSLPVDGTGVIIASVDTGIDLYHPAFFKQDGGTYKWLDVNGNKRFDPGTDAVDMNGNGTYDQGETLNYSEPPYHDQYHYGFYFNPEKYYNSKTDWLYLDSNENGRRDYGPASGYDSQSPCFGEQVFITEDLNGNNALDPGEPLLGLSTSKVFASYDSGGPHFRGWDLLDSDPDQSNHGTACFGILGGQHPGRRFTGMAPGAEFISINRTTINEQDILSGVLWAIENGADMVQYEFGSWVMEFLDGSSNLETFISDLHNDGIPQFTASGNLAGPTRKKHAVLDIQPSGTETLSFTVPESYKITEVYISLLWTGFPSSMPLTTLSIPGEAPIDIQGTGDEDIVSRYSIVSGRDQSPKGTAKLDMVISSASAISGNFSLSFKNQRSQPFQMSAYLSDNKTAWMHGAQFLDHLTDDGTITSPGTAEHCITVGAYDPRGYRDELGDISDFSSWGKTIDGRRAVDITAPGFTIITPYAHNPGHSEPGGYTNFGGTSAALPHVVGCAALLLQAMPEMTADKLAETLFRSAATDSYTGEVPNDIWGWGKLRVFDGLSTAYDVMKKPEPFFVSQAYPNPFNHRTRFDYSIITDTLHPMTVSVYNILGQHVRTLSPGVISHGTHTLMWDGTNDTGQEVSSGVYFFRFHRNGKHLTRRSLLLR